MREPFYGIFRTGTGCIFKFFGVDRLSHPRLGDSNEREWNPAGRDTILLSCG